MAEPRPLATAADARRHVEYKLGSYEMLPRVAERMLRQLGGLADDAPVDYAALLRTAIYPPAPAAVFHTAPVDARPQITKVGLRVCQPGEGGNWTPANESCAWYYRRQPAGVYVATEPDTCGMWAHWPAWDVWRIALEGLAWDHDRMNPGCYVLPDGVPTSRLRLHGTWGDRTRVRGAILGAM